MVTLIDLVSHDKISVFHGEMNKLNHPFEPYVHTDNLDTGWLGTNQTSHNYFLAVLRCLFDLEEYFPQKGTFLDLGSSVAVPSIYAAHHGWKSFGIEAYEPAYQYGLQNIIQARRDGFIEDCVRTAQGNFFPKIFNVKRGETKEEDCFKDYLEGLQFPSDDVYTSIDLNLNQVDIFYHYQVERRDNILRLVADHGKKGVFLVFVKSFNDSFILPDNMKEIGCFGRIAFVYQKD